MKVVSAKVKLVIGRKPKPSILEYAPQPACASAPKSLMFVCTTTFASAITAFCSPDGMPMYSTFWSIRPLKRIFRGIRR